MKLEWMGRYRDIVRALICFGNTSNRSGGNGFDAVEGIRLKRLEYQILEYICEHEDDNRIMSDISSSLGIVQSSVTKASNKLLKEKLIGKYRLSGNLKNIILKPTEKGKRVYDEIRKRDVEPVFRPLFDQLSSLSVDDLSKITSAIDNLSGKWGSLVDRYTLEKIED